LIVNASTGTAARASLTLVNRHALPGDAPYRRAETTDGRFDLRSVLPGAYYLTATTNGELLTGSLALNVSTEDRDGLILGLTAGHNLSGKVLAEGALAATNLAAVAVTLKPVPPALPGPAHDPVVESNTTLVMPVVRSTSRNGMLTFRDVRPWNYSVEVSHPFEEAYVKSIRLGTVDVLAAGLTLEGPPVDTLEVVLSSPGGRIEGVVFDSAQRTADGFRVVLIPERRERRDLYREVWTDNNGRFEILNLPPENYQLFAWEFEEYQMWLDPHFLRLYEGKGVPVRIEKGSRAIVKLQAIPPWF
jgi:hypothetical protein